jgi:hypothetical protein
MALEKIRIGRIRRVSRLISLGRRTWNKSDLEGQNFDYFLSFIFICLIRLICLKFNYINILSPVGCPTDWTDIRSRWLVPTYLGS